MNASEAVVEIGFSRFLFLWREAAPPRHLRFLSVLQREHPSLIYKMYDVIPQQRHQHHDTGAPPRSPHLSCTYRNCCCPRADTSDPRDVTTTQAQARCAGAGFSPLPCSVSAAAPPPHSSPLIPSSSAVILVSGARYGRKPPRTPTWERMQVLHTGLAVKSFAVKMKN